MASPLTEYQPELELFESEQLEWSGESGGGVLGETDEIEIAAELLEVRDEQELDQFLGNLIKKVGRAVGTAVRSPIGRGDRRHPQGRGQDRAAGRRRRARHVRRRSARHHDRQRARVHGRQRAWARARRFEPGGPRIRSGQAIRPFRQRGGEERRTDIVGPRSGRRRASPPSRLAAQRLAPGLLRGPGSSRPARRTGPSGRWMRRGRNVLVVNC